MNGLLDLPELSRGRCTYHHHFMSDPCFACTAVRRTALRDASRQATKRVCATLDSILSGDVMNYSTAARACCDARNAGALVIDAILARWHGAVSYSFWSDDWVVQLSLDLASTYLITIWRSDIPLGSSAVCSDQMVWVWDICRRVVSPSA